MNTKKNKAGTMILCVALGCMMMTGAALAATPDANIPRVEIGEPGSSSLPPEIERIFELLKHPGSKTEDPSESSASSGIDESGNGNYGGTMGKLIDLLYK